jgi:hypothetical protein
VHEIAHGFLGPLQFLDGPPYFPGLFRDQGYGVVLPANCGDAALFR